MIFLINTFQGANSELNSLYFQGKHPEFGKMAEFRKDLLNAIAQVFLFWQNGKFFLDILVPVCFGTRLGVSLAAPTKG